jgi:hypothetical protein
MQNTPIEWSELSRNPSTGCDKVSAGCKNFDLIKEKKGAPQPKGRKAAELRALFHQDIPEIDTTRFGEVKNR